MHPEKPKGCLFSWIQRELQYRSDKLLGTKSVDPACKKLEDGKYSEQRIDWKMYVLGGF